MTHAENDATWMSNLPVAGLICRTLMLLGLREHVGIQWHALIGATKIYFAHLCKRRPGSDLEVECHSELALHAEAVEKWWHCHGVHRCAKDGAVVQTSDARHDSEAYCGAECRIRVALCIGDVLRAVMPRQRSTVCIMHLAGIRFTWVECLVVAQWDGAKLAG
eukprot:CAMPEP_0115831146 /NCGR_PEP_ID=MMETSP0287-20121206/1987_1 /TAXON_ID=412157 /ORGANISM="Chrysochromulina rotalis, Strain UIO044" /LENGTH=162 /DNA_ID=CAMNT_0003284481 /DNA_START=447 /DNA_END=935 /DNA_ORIENTATION=+